MRVEAEGDKKENPFFIWVGGKVSVRHLNLGLCFIFGVKLWCPDGSGNSKMRNNIKM